MSDIGHFEYRGLTLRADPARDACFAVVRTDAEMHEYPGESEIGRRETLHRHMTNEITSLDIAAQCIAEYPDAPWELRLELARQCWDESRHVGVLFRRLQELGGRKGEFPISVFEWNVTCAVDNLIGRLATQNRTLEAGAMDVVGGLIGMVRSAGDEETAQVLEGILADEIQHVRFANRWIKELVGRDRRNLLKVASAVRWIAHANQAVVSEAPETNKVGTLIPGAQDRIPAVNVEDRRLAEFSDEEIHEILRQAGFRSLAEAAPPRVEA
jgi:uncharacterized ferritin-like protein (DUF455 family)